MRPLFPGIALRRWRAADAQLFHEENLREAEAAADKLAGVVVGEKLHAFFADFSDVDVPCFFAEVINGEAGAILGVAAGLILLAATLLVIAAALLFLAALLLLLAADVFLFAALLILLAALLVDGSLGLRVARLALAGGWWRRGGVGRFTRGGRGCFRGGGGLSGRLVLLCHLRLGIFLHDLRVEIAGVFGVGVHIG